MRAPRTPARGTTITSALSLRFAPRAVRAFLVTVGLLAEIASLGRAQAGGDAIQLVVSLDRGLAPSYLPDLLGGVMVLN